MNKIVIRINNAKVLVFLLKVEPKGLIYFVAINKNNSSKGEKENGRCNSI